MLTFVGDICIGEEEEDKVMKGSKTLIIKILTFVLCRELIYVLFVYLIVSYFCSNTNAGISFFDVISGSTKLLFQNSLQIPSLSTVLHPFQ
jgi:hypothetical protein